MYVCMYVMLVMSCACNSPTHFQIKKSCCYGELEVVATTVKLRETRSVTFSYLWDSMYEYATYTGT